MAGGRDANRMEEPLVDMEPLRQWIGRTETRSDTVTAVPVAALSAMLDRDDPPPRPGDPLPALWHWLYFLPIHRRSELGPDGHAKRGGFLPPVPLARRMWAGSRLAFHDPLRVGDAIRRTSRIVDVRNRQGRSAELVFVVVRHEIDGPRGAVLSEEHDIVYRDAPRPGEAPAPPIPAPEQAAWTCEIRPDDVLLFRYSALTFNGHRIHYDRRHATGVEGYPGLVVHGPLIATLLLDGLQRAEPGAQLASFAFRALRPLFDTAAFSVCGRPEPDGRSVHLWAADASGGLAVDATATLA